MAGGALQGTHAFARFLTPPAWRLVMHSFEKRRHLHRHPALTYGRLSKIFPGYRKDALTGLLNRDGFATGVERTMAANIDGTLHAMLVIEVRGLARINDVLGHARGDEALQAIAHRLRRLLPPGALAGRLENHRFALWMQGESAAAIDRVVPVLQQAISQPLLIAGMEFQLRSTIGIALHPEHSQAAGDLLRKAGIAATLALAKYGSSCQLFHPSMDDSLSKRVAIERTLRRAMERGQIVPYYQPIMDLRDGHIRGCEALARCTYADPLLQKADQFIPIAEETGLIYALSDDLLKRACTDAKEWPPHVALSFNVSPVLLHEKDFAGRFLHLVMQAGFQPDRLEVEITESAWVHDIYQANATLERLKHAGVRLALDDFGTGCSSLQHLQCFKVNRLKIEKTFIDRVFHDTESAAIVKSLVALGRELKVSLTAEGVEDARQRRFLEDVGCDEIQGFLISAAIPAEEIKAFLVQSQYRGFSTANGLA